MEKYLNDLINQKQNIVNILTSYGVSATTNERLNTLIPKLRSCVEYANIIKPTVSGTAVAVHDVDSREHELGVAVKSKNLFDINTEMYSGRATSTLDENNIFTITAPEGAGWSSANFKIPFPETLVGKKIIISAKAKSSTGNEYAAIRILYFNDATAVTVSGMNEFMTKTNSTEFTDISVTGTVLPLPEGQTGYLCISLYANAGGAFGNAPVSYYKDVQIEIGTDKTDYTPYVDVGSIRESKNLLDFSKCTPYSIASYGITTELENDNTVHAYGTTDTTGANFFNILTTSQTELCGKGYIITAFPVSGAEGLKRIYGLRTENEKNIAIQYDLTEGVYYDIRFKVMVSAETPIKYEPYGSIGIGVSRYGKNVLSRLAIWRYSGDDYSIEPIYLKKGDTITFSFEGTYDNWRLMFFGTDANGTPFEQGDGINVPTNNDDAYIQGTYTGASGRLQYSGNVSGKKTRTHICNQDCIITGMAFWNAASEVDKTFYNCQIEFSDTPTEYKPYKEPQTATANSEGVVEGLVSLSPNMTLISDTEGVIINCTYNVDTKTYIDNKVLALQTAMVSG